MSRRLYELVRDPIARTYIERDGWWADLVLDEFTFLTDYGYELENVSFHFRGNSVVYEGPRARLVFEYAPEDGDILELWYTQVGSADRRPIDAVLTKEDASYRPPPKDKLTHNFVATRLSMWASALRLLGREIL